MGHTFEAKHNFSCTNYFSIQVVLSRHKGEAGKNFIQEGFQAKTLAGLMLERSYLFLKPAEFRDRFQCEGHDVSLVQDTFLDERGCRMSDYVLHDADHLKIRTFRQVCGGLNQHYLKPKESQLRRAGTLQGLGLTMSGSCGPSSCTAAHCHQQQQTSPPSLQGRSRQAPGG